jgi:NAD(P)-dependent dehydrogenase (short-subunit alcohol dehydrogenase family)
VVAGVRSPCALNDLAAEYPDRLALVELDVTKDDHVHAAVATAIDRFGRLDVLVNNAGYANMGAVEDVDFEDFRTQIDTNFFGVVRLTRAALPVMRSQRAGHILQVSSVGGRLVRPGLAAYQSAKWAVTGFSGVLAQEVAPLGIKVTVPEPGGMRTDWAGASMRIDPVRDEYAATVGAAATIHKPEHLGASDRYATAAGRDLLATDEKWEALTVSTTADDATNDQLDPLGSVNR